MERGLLFLCAQAKVDLDRPAGEGVICIAWKDHDLVWLNPVDIWPRPLAAVLFSALQILRHALCLPVLPPIFWGCPLAGSKKV
jgi:hypothetical protein